MRKFETKYMNNVVKYFFHICMLFQHIFFCQAQLQLQLQLKLSLALFSNIFTTRPPPGKVYFKHIWSLTAMLSWSFCHSVLFNQSNFEETNFDETNFDESNFYETNFDETNFDETDFVVSMKLFLMKLILMNFFWWN